MLQKETVIQRNNQTNSSHTTTAPTPSPSIYLMDSEGIDFRKYAQLLMDQWKIISASALLFGLLSLILSFFQPITYTTEAGVTLLNIRSEVVFDPTFTTVPLEVPSGQQDKRGRALEALAENSSLLNRVYSQVQPQLQDGSPANLDEVVFATATGDFLQLRVTWSNPEDAALIANEWAAYYVETANRAYVSTTSNTPEEAQQSADEAFQSYQTVQQEYEAFLAQNRLDQIESEIKELDALLAKLRELKTSAVVLLNTSSISSNNQLATSTTGAFQREIDQSVQREISARARELDYWYERRATLKTMRETLGDIRAQLEAGSTLEAAATGDYLAVMLARAGLMPSNNPTTSGEPAAQSQIQLQISLDQLTGANGALSVETVDALLKTVNESITEADKEIKERSQELFLGVGLLDTPTVVTEEHELFARVQAQVDAVFDTAAILTTEAAQFDDRPLQQSLVQLSEQRQKLQAEAEGLHAQQRELTRNRDAAWELYTTLDNKAREADAQFATGAPQVRLAVPATPSTEPASAPKIVFPLVGLLVGTLLATLYLIGRELWSGSIDQSAVPMPLRDPQPAGD